jgi:hypothetical protein
MNKGSSARLYPLTGQNGKGRVSFSISNEKEKAPREVAFQRIRNAYSVQEYYTSVEIF